MEFTNVCNDLKANPKLWVVTGCAGFIGSNLLQKLLQLGQRVVGLDNFSTGYQYNLDQVQSLVSKEQWANFTFLQGSICDLRTCEQATEDADYVLHQAALGSVPRSINDPLTSHHVNVTGHLNMLFACSKNNVKNMVYAASSSTYGDHPGLPKIEDRIGKPLSPYAVTKLVNEHYADVYNRVYGLNTVGLRYFNVFGRRQDPNGAYAAVIPLWVSSMLKNEDVYINGDGETTRDFCYIDNVVQANILAAVAKGGALNEIYNVAVGDRNTLNDLHKFIAEALTEKKSAPIYREFREGDIRDSQADITKAKTNLGYAPQFNLQQGLLEAISWYKENL